MNKEGNVKRSIMLVKFLFSLFFPFGYSFSQVFISPTPVLFVVFFHGSVGVLQVIPGLASLVWPLEGLRIILDTEILFINPWVLDYC